jgi:hypothetical protein
MRANTARAYLFCFSDEANPTNPVWYAGLGVPFKTTTDIRYAKSVVFDSHEASMLIRSLEKHYGKTFHQILLKDAVGTPDFRCAGCGLPWTSREQHYARLLLDWEGDDAMQHQEELMEELSFTHLGSSLRIPAEVSSFAEKINNSRRCINDKCASLFCADCAPPRRGRTAGSCQVCKPSRRRS